MRIPVTVDLTSRVKIATISLPSGQRGNIYLLSLGPDIGIPESLIAEYYQLIAASIIRLSEHPAIRELDCKIRFFTGDDGLLHMSCDKGAEVAGLAIWYHPELRKVFTDLGLGIVE